MRIIKTNAIGTPAEEIELDRRHVDTITELGKNNPVRYNTPYLYHPQWDIDVFDSPEEKGASVKVW